VTKLSVFARGKLSLQTAEQEVPENVHGGVNQRRRKNRTGLAPSPTVEKSRDGRQKDIPPVGEM
jgi:hypothetical protein